MLKSMTPPVVKPRVVVDTDVGSDMDDLWAIAGLVALERMHLVGTHVWSGVVWCIVRYVVKVCVRDVDCTEWCRCTSSCS